MHPVLEAALVHAIARRCQSAAEHSAWQPLTHTQADCQQSVAATQLLLQGAVAAVLDSQELMWLGES